MRARIPTLVIAAVLTAVVPARARNKAKEECKQNCVITLQTCKQDCQVERDSGTQEESELYRNCDLSCRDDYAGCKSECENP